MDDTEEVITTLQDLATANMSHLLAIFVPSMLEGPTLATFMSCSTNESGRPIGRRWCCAVALALITVSTLLSMVYTVPIANAILGPNSPARRSADRMLRHGRGWCCLFWLVIGALMAGDPATAVISAIFARLLPLFSSLLLLGAFAGSVLLYFVFDAIVIADVGPIDAIRSVRKSFDAISARDRP